MTIANLHGRTSNLLAKGIWISNASERVVSVVSSIDRPTGLLPASFARIGTNPLYLRDYEPCDEFRCPKR